MRKHWLIPLFCIHWSVGFAQFTPPPLSPLEQKIRAALQSDIRTQAEKARDGDRQPMKTLEFFRLEDNLKVVEIMPQEGWYTKILGPVLADRGELYVAPLGSNPIQALTEGHASLAKVRLLPFGGKLVPVTETGIPMGYFDLTEFVLPVDDVDLILTFRNYHNLTPIGRKSLNAAAYKALKQCGLYGVLDHTRRHNEPDTLENWRRMDPVLVIKEVQSVGFALVDFSNVNYRADDELRYEVGRRSVKGNTDRFTLLFRKPAEGCD